MNPIESHKKLLLQKIKLLTSYQNIIDKITSFMINVVLPIHKLKGW